MESLLGDGETHHLSFFAAVRIGIKTETAFTLPLIRYGVNPKLFFLRLLGYKSNPRLPAGIRGGGTPHYLLSLLGYGENPVWVLPLLDKGRAISIGRKQMGWDGKGVLEREIPALFKGEAPFQNTVQKYGHASQRGLKPRTIMLVKPSGMLQR
jgi:hypothetical protein